MLFEGTFDTVGHFRNCYAPAFLAAVGADSGLTFSPDLGAQKLFADAGKAKILFFGIVVISQDSGSKLMRRRRNGAGSYFQSNLACLALQGLRSTPLIPSNATKDTAVTALIARQPCRSEVQPSFNQPSCPFLGGAHAGRRCAFEDHEKVPGCRSTLIMISLSRNCS